MIETIKRNILLTDSDIIVQQTNCINVMGGGLAREIAQRYPEVKKEFHKFSANKTPEELLGEVLFVDTYDQKIIANVFGQLKIRKNSFDKTVYTDKPSLMRGLSEVKDRALALNFTISIPTGIGCGMANGDWDEIRPAIEELFADCEHLVTFYHFTK